MDSEKSKDVKYNNSDEDPHSNEIVTEEGEIINVSGHRDQLSRQYGLLAICGLAVTVDNAWVIMATTLSLAISSGGPAGVLYELMVGCFYYMFIGASIAEMASAMPTSGGVYHWASILPGPRSGRMLGFFTGSINFFGWIFDLASVIYVMAELIVQMYALYHPNFVILPWHLFVCLVGITWACVLFIIFCNRLLPALQSFGMFMVNAGALVTVIVLAVMPEQRASARDVFVWNEDNNVTGWSPGVAFLVGVLNGAFTIGTPDSVTHLAEELPEPRVQMPKAIFAQLILGTLYSFVVAVTIFFGVTDLNAVVNANGSFPVAEAYLQATNGNVAATFGLLFIILLAVLSCVVATTLTVSRIWWALARDNATPAAALFSRVNERLSCPVPAAILTGVLVTAFGAISLGSKSAFQALTGSFIILTSCSYLIAILANLVNRRKYMPRTGYFRMEGWLGYVINILSCLFIVFFDVIFCFPPVNPPTPALMSYNSVILVGIFLVTAAWWLIHGARKYPGPRIATVYFGTGDGSQVGVAVGDHIGDGGDGVHEKRKT